MPDAAQITRRAKSNLAFALRILPRQQRQDMVVFYAFCRSIDDLADEPGVPVAERLAALNAWSDGIRHGFAEPTPLQQQLVSLCNERAIPPDLLEAIIDGCRMDLQPQRFVSWEDLSGYIWKVACAVGLVSIRLFGCTDPGSADYAVALGHSLQLTNILRDIGEDFANGGRLYLPLDDLARFHYTEHDLASQCRDERFLTLMEFEADRAAGYFRAAAGMLPAADRKPLTPALIMADVYQDLLGRMRRDGFQVFGHRYRVPRVVKLAIFAKHLLGSVC